MGWKEVIQFWFEECTPKQWFTKDEAFDAKVRERFQGTYWRVVKGESAQWRTEPEGRLAEIIVLDQFARNIFRNSPRAFEYDPLALDLAEEAVHSGDDRRLPKRMRRFLYMPYMHSESAEVHRKAFWLFLSLFDWETLKYEIKHKRIIDRFGRYPHRNEILGRKSTEAEKEFIKNHRGF
ncbi:DUF924 domain-containing protein [Candidatus Kaiserbacteria bacterium CG10_big_fil_rev_8_21_14_0_10_51_14]|uniref:DUF924 domain-containing protein n=1 Tax=Candidatus Kaiserbacteria bacterium CG10_big_fil_rev_8_21_14_0_10_51_14 TaxID=1974610 RepID=A0A2H0UDL3_9BACT|nr:MAG: DUF924 domain-containing protein [Candidatus Kaiserbacteria bacterium CG10_big_fil_rev_8_21_14_0_10_51_14]